MKIGRRILVVAQFLFAVGCVLILTTPGLSQPAVEYRIHFGLGELLIGICFGIGLGWRARRPEDF